MSQDDCFASRPAYSRHATDARGDFAGLEAKQSPSSPEHRYVRRRLLGVGERGRVEEAFDTVLQRSVALKILREPSPTALAQFQREQAITAELDHPGIVTIHDAGLLNDGLPYYTMRLVRGRSLAASLSNRHPHDDPSLLAALIQLCDAVGFAHDRGIVHRDLKPDNMMLGDFGEAIVVDWGLATHQGAERMGSAAVGTPLYMSPEQARGASPHPTADVWSLGLILYEVVARRLAFQVTQTSALLERLERLPPTWSLPLPPEVPLELGAILGRATAVQASHRYPHAQALAEDLRAFLDGRQVAAYSYSKGALLKRALHAWRVPVAFGLGGAALLLALAGSAYQRVVRERDRANEAQAEAQRKQDQANTLSAQLLADKAVTSSLEHAAFEAEDLARRSLARRDSPEARGVMSKSAFELKLRVLEVFPTPCREPSMSDRGTLALCSVGDTLSLHPTWGGPPLWSQEIATGAHSMHVSEELARVVILSADNTLRQLTLAGEPVGTKHRVPRARIVQPLAYPIQLSWRGYAAELSASDELYVEQSACFGETIAIARVDGVLVALCADESIIVGGERLTPHNATGLADVDMMLRVGPGRLVAASQDSLFRFDLETRTLTRVDRELSSTRGYLTALGDGMLALASDRPGVELWDTASMSPLVRLPGDWGTDVVPLSDGSFLSVGAENFIHWERDERSGRGRFEHDSGIASVALSRDGTKLATTEGSGALNVWSRESGALLAQRRWEPAVLKSASFTPDGRFLLALSSRGSGVRVFDAQTFELANILLGDKTHRTWGRRVLTLAGGRVVALSYSGGFLLWGNPLQQGLPDSFGRAATMLDASTSLNGEHAALLSSAGQIWVIHADGSPPRQIMRAIDARAVDIDEAGERILVAYNDSTVLVDPAGETRMRAPNRVGLPIDASISSVAGVFAVATHVGAVGVWDLKTAELRGELRGHKRRVVSVEFGDGVLATASWDGAAQLWSLQPLLASAP